jgi:hypothetical protein
MAPVTICGFPVDVVVFDINSSTVYNYELSMHNSQRVLVVNATTTKKVRIFSNAIWLRGMVEKCRSYQAG